MGIIELIFVLILMKFIEDIGIVGTCLLYGILNVIGAFFYTGGIVAAFFAGVVHGFFAYLAVIFFLFLIRVLGALGSFLVGLFFVLALIAIIL